MCDFYSFCRNQNVKIRRHKIHQQHTPFQERKIRNFLGSGHYPSPHAFGPRRNPHFKAASTAAATRTNSSLTIQAISQRTPSTNYACRLCSRFSRRRLITHTSCSMQATRPQAAFFFLQTAASRVEKIRGREWQDDAIFRQRKLLVLKISISPLNPPK